MLTGAEFGEEDTRHTQGRDSSPSANTQHLCDTLGFVYILDQRHSKINYYHFKRAISVAAFRILLVCRW
jgi:hypothetical protein